MHKKVEDERNELKVFHAFGHEIRGWQSLYLGIGINRVFCVREDVSSTAETNRKLW